MKQHRILLTMALAAACALAQAAVEVVSPESWTLYKGSTIVQPRVAYPNKAACQAAAPVVDTRYKCQGSETFVRRADAPPPPPQPPTCTAPQPATETRSQACPSGTTGTWSQARSYSAAAYPTCWTAGAWMPAAAPSGACTPVVTPPPPPPPPTSSDVVAAASCSQPDVSAALTAVKAGGTVTVPACSASWSGMSIAKPVTLKGAGAAQTKISVANVSIVKQTAGVIRITGFGFSKSGGGNESAAFVISGPWPGGEPVVLTANEFTVSGSGLILGRVPGGVVVAGNKFTGQWDDSFLKLKLPGDKASWTTNSSMGAADTAGKLNWYIESNTMRGGTNQGIDADDGARVVFRYNRMEYTSFNSHGLDTSETGVRHWEVYRNAFLNNGAGGWSGSSAMSDLSNQNWAIWIRGGTGVIFENQIDDIANSYWGPGKSEIKFDIRAQQDGSGSSYGTKAPPVAKYSAGRGDYPRERQLGQSWDESKTNSVGIAGGRGDYVTDPIFIWANTGAGASSNGGVKGLANGGSWGSHGDHFQLGRDFFVGTQKPGYAPFVYPHPAL